MRSKRRCRLTLKGCRTTGRRKLTIFYEIFDTKICWCEKIIYFCQKIGRDPKLCCSIYFGVGLLRSKLALFLYVRFNVLYMTVALMVSKNE